MAPACILLDRTVAFRNNSQETEEPVDTTLHRPILNLPSREGAESSLASYLQAMTPDLEVVEPPDVSRLAMHLPLSSDHHPLPGYHERYLRNGAVAASAHKNLVVLVSGTFRSPTSYNRGYLLFDLDADTSSSSSLSTVPAIDVGVFDQYKSAGHGAVIMTREGGGFVLAELLFDHCRHSEHPRQYALCLWQSSLCSWVYKHGEIPAEVRPSWRIHMSFPVQTRNSNLFCWVNLLHGLLLCDLGPNCDVSSLDVNMLSFVPLPPHGRVISNSPWWPTPQEFRNMACVDGTIKFVNLEGNVERGPISLVTYALDLDNPSPSWMPDTRLLLEDLWTDKTFISKDVPRITPLFPILSTLEHDVVYLVIPGDMESEGCQFRGVKLQLSVDMRKNRVISVTQQKQPRPLVFCCNLLAFSASHSQCGSKYPQERWRLEMGASRKRLKLE